MRKTSINKSHKTEPEKGPKTRHRFWPHKRWQQRLIVGGLVFLATSLNMGATVRYTEYSDNQTIAVNTIQSDRADIERKSVVEQYVQQMGLDPKELGSAFEQLVAAAIEVDDFYGWVSPTVRQFLVSEELKQRFDKQVIAYKDSVPEMTRTTLVAETVANIEKLCDGEEMLESSFAHNDRLSSALEYDPAADETVRAFRVVQKRHFVQVKRIAPTYCR